MPLIKPFGPFFKKKSAKPKGKIITSKKGKGQTSRAKKGQPAPPPVLVAQPSWWEKLSPERKLDVVGIILAFIFLTPRDWFRDQPRIPKASNIFLLRKENGGSKYWVPAGLVALNQLSA